MTATPLRRAVLSAIIALAACSVLLIRPILVSDVAQPWGIGEAIVAIPSSLGVTQTFVATGDHVDGVGVVIAKGRAATGTVTAAIVPAPRNSVSPNDLAEAHGTANVAAFTDWENVHFTFPRTALVPGKSYTLRITSTNGLAMAAGTSDLYPGGSAAVAGQPQPSDMIFRIYRRLTLADLGRKLTGVPVWVVVLMTFLMAYSAAYTGILLARMPAGSSAVSHETAEGDSSEAA